ncbi:MAG: pyruvate, phosphate dikinase, partial [Candidatus Aenigmarchaeota archaeon]|nr:pyruvate, phosphate dikinase [Candidatus Aenigmarchaeota archaeon]
MTTKKYVYSFEEGRGLGKEMLGGKGANLADMVGLGLPVPPGFTITTEACVYYFKNSRRNPPGMKEQVEGALAGVEKDMGRKFGDPDNPLLVSVRSGARRSMPGMMETVLNIGLTEKTMPGLVRQNGGNARFVYDAYRRLIMMYSDVVMEKAEGIEPEHDMGIRRQLERIMADMKKEKGCRSDTDLTLEDLKKLCALFKAK